MATFTTATPKAMHKGRISRTTFIIAMVDEDWCCLKWLLWIYRPLYAACKHLSSKTALNQYEAHRHGSVNWSPPCTTHEQANIRLCNSPSSVISWLRWAPHGRKSQSLWLTFHFNDTHSHHLICQTHSTMRPQARPHLLFNPLKVKKQAACKPDVLFFVQC